MSFSLINTSVINLMACSMYNAIVHYKSLLLIVFIEMPIDFKYTNFTTLVKVVFT